MAACSLHLALFPLPRRPVAVRNDGGALSSDAGALLLRELDERLGLTARLAGCLADGRDPLRVRHGVLALHRAAGEPARLERSEQDLLAAVLRPGNIHAGHPALEAAQGGGAGERVGAPGVGAPALGVSVGLPVATPRVAENSIPANSVTRRCATAIAWRSLRPPRHSPHARSTPSKGFPPTLMNNAG